MSSNSFVNQWNIDLIDQNYEVWLQNPESLTQEWTTFFEGFALGNERPAKGGTFSKDDAVKQAHVIQLIENYRSLGHTDAKINPLNKTLSENPSLKLETFNLNKEDLNKEFYTGSYLGGRVLPLKTIIEQLKNTYCGTTACEFTHIQNTEKRTWLQNKIEEHINQSKLSKETKIRAFHKIQDAEDFEHFLHTRYIGQKRFSVEGGESLLVALDTILENSGAENIKEVMIGMAHRGRLNVLANTLGKKLSMIFEEFSPNFVPDSMYGDGDVKYHLGYSSTHTTGDKKEVKVHLAANPSHLEAVNSVVEGRTRALQRTHADLEDRNKVLPILIHGDAAIIGQGVVAEVLNMARLEGYTTGGTLHIVVNNQIGFTAIPEESRSGRYCTDIVKMIDAPIFHVNGDDPLAVIMATNIALEYRQKFNEDAVIDIYCYRKYGHNESDEPKFTQPILYKEISKHPKVSDVLSKQLITDGDLSQKEIDSLKKKFRDTLEKSFDKVKQKEEDLNKDKDKFKGSDAIFQRKYSFAPLKTEASKAQLEKVVQALTHIPDGFDINPKIKRQSDTKQTNFNAGSGIDWGFAEALAFGTLLNEGTPIRLSGQDCARGTFSHRHAVVYDINNRNKYIPLRNISDKQAQFCVHNSCLSEAGVLGFDYGYSLDFPQMLCIWEAQFGDFVNGAQVMIDQFIASGESKWQQASGIVLLLPHGYEGQGPEHSSARLERFLQSCAEDNMQICNITTPAQYFHALRRQMKQKFLKPLIIMSPKSLLRHKECVSALDDFTSGHFETILDDLTPAKKTERLILCSGKIYYDLKACREENNITNSTILRIEQLYPLNKDKLSKLINKHKGFKHLIWCQEESENMGAWSFINPLLEKCAKGVRPKYVGRDASSSPAVGSLARHKVEQETLIKEAFGK